jgi:hypothetical protein
MQGKAMARQPYRCGVGAFGPGRLRTGGGFGLATALALRTGARTAGAFTARARAWQRCRGSVTWRGMWHTRWRRRSDERA